MGDDGPGGSRSPALEETGSKNEDVDLYEINEAFSVAAIAVTRELWLDPNKVYVDGGAVALGPPIGATGARILTTCYARWSAATFTRELLRSVKVAETRRGWR